MSIELRDVRWSAGGRMVVDGVTLRAAPGRMLGLLGPNGSGKSSLLRLICGLRQVQAGVVEIDGTPMTAFSRRRLAQRMALVDQHSTTDSPVSVADVVRLGRIPHRNWLAPWTPEDEARVAAALAHVGLTDRRLQSWHSLSGGERQRAQIARALAQSPSELLLDEPTNHLDVRHQFALLGLVSRLPMTVVVAIHDLNLAARFCQEVALLHEGKLVAAGTPADVLTPARIEAVFGMRTDVQPATRHDGLHITYLSEA
jgi:iron complex transport system ATP-binding protein